MSGRTIYLEDLPLAEARVRFERATAAVLARNAPEEIVPIDEALGRVTTRPVFARLSSPHYHACAMDGIAVRAADTRGARETAPLLLHVGTQAHWVDTGDPLPEGTDAVIMVEEVEERGAAYVAIHAAVAPYHHVRGLGEDVVATEAVAPARRLLAAADLAAIAAAGVTQVPVVKLPVVAIITTGDELIDPATPRPERGAIIDSNGILLAALVHQYGAIPIRYPAVGDNVEALRATLADALARADVVVVNAGSSAGSADYTARMFREVGTVAVHGVAIRPGHPVILGVSEGREPRPLLGIPGYPVSAAICADLFLRPLIDTLCARSARDDEYVSVTLARKLFSPLGEDEYVRAVVARIGERLVATPLRRGAGVITSLSRANALIVVSRESEGIGQGEPAQARLLRPRSQIERTLLAVGSHDVGIDLLAGMLAQGGIELTSAHVGSIAGIVALADRAAHMAGTHVLDAPSGTYNVESLKRYAPGLRLALVHFAMRQQGLIVRRGNPLKLRSISEVAEREARFVNRQKDAGTRMLLDAILAREGIAAEAIAGYERIEFTHLAVAALVAEGSADCGLGILAAAQALECDFVPITDEPYELAMRVDDLDDSRFVRVLAALRDPELQAAVEALGGYDMRAAGSIRYV